MISIGLAGWGDHAKLYKAGIKPQERLKEYSKFFSLVEVDSSYYAIHKDSLYRKWAGDTSGHFSFVVKAYQGMTGHTRQAYSEDDLEVMFRDFRESIGPVIEAGKLKAVLFQYPPWFDCSRHNIAVLRSARKRMEDIPVALEFRHQSWFKPDMMQKTLTFMREEGWIHTVCDEPQVGDGSVPIVEAAVDPQLTLVRLHGRSNDGWLSSGQPNWREVRYLYRYNEQELEEWAQRLIRLEQLSETVCILFNNNSGGDAADNALQLMAMLGQTPPRGFFGEDPQADPVEQLDLFDLPGEE